MTVVRLAGGRLWIHSPIALSEALAGRIEALGEVAFLIAPNTLHYWWAPEWKARYPGAALWAAPGLARRARRPVPIDQELGSAAPDEWAEEIDQLVLAGDALTEAVFFHRASRTLILTDQIENFEPARVRRAWLRWLLRFSGAADPDGAAPHDMRLGFLRQRKAVRAAADRMIAWGPERVILAHGRWYERDGVAELRRAFRWAR